MEREVIYVIEANVGDKSVFKIGTTSKCPYERLRQLQLQNAAPLRLVAGLIGNKEDEQAFHWTFEKFRLHGEWFSDCSGIRKLISDFPIDRWNMLIQAYEWGGVDFNDAYRELTLLKFEVS